jgi:hypothetical protein
MGAVACQTSKHRTAWMSRHPTPRSWQLLGEDQAISQLMLSDALGHTGRIWDHVVAWSKSYMLGEIIVSRQAEMLKRYAAWKRGDPLTVLPPPPE